MGRDNQAKQRQLARRTAKAARRAEYARILIVTEGEKTEPLYLQEICALHRLHSANIEIQPCQLGTAPLQVVTYAQKLFEEGDLHKGIRAQSFDQIYAVFDRDDHHRYFDALSKVNKLDGKLRNDDKRPVRFKAIASIPSFELWLLLHYEDIQAPIHRDEVMARLKQHVLGYDKGARGTFAHTQNLLTAATKRAQALATRNNAHTDPEPYTAMHELVTVLTTLRA